jgi:hypothetical protein
LRRARGTGGESFGEKWPDEALGLLRFVHFPSFTRDWRRLELGDEALRTLEQEIIDSPDGAPVIEHAGGLRKMRFAPPGLGKGKSGAFRVCYAYFPLYGTIALFVVFGKNERSDISRNEAREISKALKAFESELRRQFERRV